MVRSTRPCILVTSSFVQEKQYSWPREDNHKAKWPLYPHPSLYLSKTHHYFFRTSARTVSWLHVSLRILRWGGARGHAWERSPRNDALRHLRLEQVVRYFSTAGGLMRGEATIEDTIEMDDEAVLCDEHHRHYDRMCEKTAPGTKYPSRAQGLDVLQRRRQAHLAVSRIPFLEPLGGKRENYYQQNPREGIEARPSSVLDLCPHMRRRSRVGLNNLTAQH